MIAGLPFSDPLFLFSFNIISIDNLVDFVISQYYNPAWFGWKIYDRDTNRLIGRSATYLGV